jgi:hypothetical protein
MPSGNVTLFPSYAKCGVAPISPNPTFYRTVKVRRLSIFYREPGSDCAAGGNPPQFLVGAVVRERVEKGLLEESILREWVDGALERAEHRGFIGLTSP